MTPEHWQKVEQLFDAALERDETERAAYLDHACGGDDTLRQEVESLLLHEKGAKSFLDSPGVEVAAKMFEENSGQSMMGASWARTVLCL